MGGKLIIFGFLTFYSYQICYFLFIEIIQKKYIYFIISEIVLKLFNTQSDGKELSQLLLDAFGINNIMDWDSVLQTLTSNSIQTIILALFKLYVAIKLLIMSIKILERVFFTIFYTIMSPLAFACGVAKSTKAYLQGWIKSVVGNSIYQILLLTSFILVIFIINGGDKINESINVYLSSNLKYQQYSIGGDPTTIATKVNFLFG